MGKTLQYLFQILIGKYLFNEVNATADSNIAHEKLNDKRANVYVGYQC